MQTRNATPVDRASVVRLIADAQSDPTRRIAYLADVAEAIDAELEELGTWHRHATVAVDGGALVGALIADVDDRMGRAWLLGPWAPDDRHADALYAGLLDLPLEQELAPTEANAFVARFARRNGFVEEEGSVALRRDGGAMGVTGPRPMADDERELVALLHDATFPGTHRTGEDLVSGRHRILVDGPAGAVDGYVASEIQPDGSGYVDFLGVRVGARGRGLGRRLVGAAVDDLLDAAVGHVHLTVRAGNGTARRLYASVGFVEDMVLVPYRKGFSLD